MPMDDAALLERWTRRRDTDAFNEIVERFAGQVYVTCRRVLNNDADAEDVAQECFFALARSSGEVRSSLGGWLHRVATFKSRDRIRADARRQRRERAYSDSQPESAEPSWNDIREHVDEAIEALPEELRDAIVAHFLGRKSHAEIASELGLTRRAVSYRIERGLETVRNELRRRGIAVSAATLGTSLVADASAAPLSLKASLGKLAIAAGTTSGASGSTAISAMLGSVVLMKTKSFLVAGIAIAIVAGLYFAFTQSSPDTSRGNSEPTNTSDTLQALPKPTIEPAQLRSTFAANAETPSVDDLLALSRRELERDLARYPLIKDPALYASLSGVVLDQNAYPVPGAAIVLVPTHRWGTMPGSEDVARTATSGADGVYRIDDIKREGDYRVVASKQGYATEAQYTPIKAGKNVTLDITIKTGPSIQGHVVSATGEPVADAYVYCISATGPRQLVNDLSRATQTDAEGHFTLGFKDEENGFVAALRVQSAKHGAATFPDVHVQSDRMIELRLAAQAVIRGTVKDSSGKPLSGAHLTFYGQKTIDLKRDDGEAWSSPSYATQFIAVSDGAGRYATEVDAALDFQVKVEVQGFDDGSERMDQIPALIPGETREYNAEFDTECITVRATFVGQNSGQPFPSYVPIEAIAFDGERPVAQGQPDGHFALRLTLPGESGTYTFQARYMYDRDIAGEITKPYELDGGDDIEVTLTVPDPQSFAVRTVDPTGQPVEGASIKFLTETWSGDALNYGSTNADGRLDEPILLAPQSGAQLLVEKPGYALAFGPPYPDQNPGTVHSEETIVLWPGAGFEGVLLDAEKQPVSDTPLSITVTNRDGQQWPLRATTDAQGHFAILSQAPADTVNIEIAIPDDPRTWKANQLQLQADAITSLGELTAE